MSPRISKATLGVAVAIIIAAGLLTVARATAASHIARDNGYRSGRSDGYLEGLQVGEAQGRQEGRALQAGSSLPAESRQPVQAAFNAGYAAGANDAFAGYDGGWVRLAPYVVVLEAGSGQIVYRISSRTLVQPHINYYLCPDGHDLCQQSQP
jgi:hypothetical protein